MLLASAGPTHAEAPDGQPDSLADHRAVFIEAWRRAGRGDADALAEAIARIPDYVLTPYLRFELKRQTLDRVDGPEMERFLARYRDWSFADQLEQRWLNRLARRGDRDALLRYGDNARSAEARCQLERGRLEQGRIDGLADRVRALWLHPQSQPRACDPLFAWWRRQGHPDADTAWHRFGLAVEAGEYRLARYLKRYLTPGDRQWADGWLRIAGGSVHELAQAGRWPDRERARELLAWGLYRLAANDWQQATTLLARFEARFAFEPGALGATRRRIALFRAVDLDAGAITAIDDLAAHHVDQQMLEWRLRAALANEDWRAVLDSIARMDAEQQLRERWRYWRARALAALGRAEAGLVYATLAAESDYYGFLAALRSGQPLMLCSRDIDADGDIQRRLLRDAEFERAMELYRTGLVWHARWTFQRVANRLRAAELRQAALLAAGAGWHDRAITALARSGAMDAYPWRFPIVERERVVAAATRESIDPALVLGLMRAESAMQPDARSPAGARGLLQLMDGTARGVARRHGISYSGPADLYRPERNIMLGTTHLGELHERFDGDWTLIAAAYNAGIGNAERWRRERPDLPRDIWIETLPFYETRDYIPRVLAFATIYEWKLGSDPGVLAANVLEDPPATTEFTCPTT